MSENRVNHDLQDIGINDLPLETLNFIFSFLSPKERLLVEEVCQLWKYVGTNFSWTDVQSIDFRKYDLNFNNYGSEIDTATEILKRSGKYLNDIICSSFDFKLLSKHCPNLVCINIKESNIGDAALEAISLSCIKLKKINLGFCTKLTDKGITLLLKYSEIKNLNLEHTKIEGSCFEILSQSDIPTRANNTLQSINLHSCFHLRDKGVTALLKCTSIKYLNCGHTNIKGSCFKHFAKLSTCERTCIKLRDINLAYCENMTEASIAELLRHSKIERLNLTGLNISGSCLRFLSKSVISLNLWLISGLSSGCLDIFQIVGPSINDLCLPYNYPEPEICISYCENLLSLNLCQNENLTNGGLDYITRNCPNLIILDLLNTNIDRRGLHSLCRLKNLNYLRIKDIPVDGYCKQIGKLKYHETLSERGQFRVYCTERGVHLVEKNKIKN